MFDVVFLIFGLLCGLYVAKIETERLWIELREVQAQNVKLTDLFAAVQAPAPYAAYMSPDIDALSTDTWQFDDSGLIAVPSRDES